MNIILNLFSGLIM